MSNWPNYQNSPKWIPKLNFFFGEFAKEHNSSKQDEPENRVISGMPIYNFRKTLAVPSLYFVFRFQNFKLSVSSNPPVYWREFNK